MADILTNDELKQALVTDNVFTPSADQYKFADNNATQVTGLNPQQSLKQAIEEQVFYQNAVNNGLTGIEGTPTNDQIAESYQANAQYNKLYDAPEGEMDWDAASKLEDSGLLRDLKNATENGNTEQFQAEQWTNETMDNIDNDDDIDDNDQGVDSIAERPDIYGQDYEVAGGDASQYADENGELPDYMFQDEQGNVIIDLAQRERILSNPQENELIEGIKDQMDPDSFANLDVAEDDFDMEEL